MALTLTREDYSSPYLDRVRDKVPQTGEGGLEAVQREIVAEMAYALQRAERKIIEALLECDLRALHWLEAPDDMMRERHATEFASARERARRAKWEYMVHREAIGLLWTDEIDREFPIPPALALHAATLD